MLNDSMQAAMDEATFRETAATPYLSLAGEQFDEIDQALGAMAG